MIWDAAGVCRRFLLPFFHLLPVYGVGLSRRRLELKEQGGRASVCLGGSPSLAFPGLVSALLCPRAFGDVREDGLRGKIPEPGCPRSSAPLLGPTACAPMFLPFACPVKKVLWPSCCAPLILGWPGALWVGTHKPGSRYATALQHGNLCQQDLAWNIIKHTQTPRNRNAIN